MEPAVYIRMWLWCIAEQINATGGLHELNELTEDTIPWIDNLES